MRDQTCHGTNRSIGELKIVLKNTLFTVLAIKSTIYPSYLDFSCRVGEDSDCRLVAEADAALSASRSAFSRSMEPESAKVRRCLEMQMIWSRSLCTVASSVT